MAALMMAVVGVLIFSVLLVGDMGLLPVDASTAVPWSLRQPVQCRSRVLTGRWMPRC